MANQAAVIASTVAAMKKVIQGNKDYPSSDSENEPPRPTNRGNKLKRKAEYFHERELGGRRPYKRKIRHAGYYRYIVHTNPKRYDGYGHELSDDEEDEVADAEVAEWDPYSDIHLQGLLMPLTAASELADHPSLAYPYRSMVLPEMVEQACEMVRKERKTLWEMKHLATELRGDHTHVPCGLLHSDNDYDLFPVDHILEALQEASTTVRVNGHERVPDREPDSSDMFHTGVPTTRIQINGVEISSDRTAADGTLRIQDEDGRQSERALGPGLVVARPGEAEALSTVIAIESAVVVEARPGPSARAESEAAADGAGPMEADSPAPRMLTRAAAHAADQPPTRTPSPPSSVQFIHPLFIPPLSSLPHRDLHLPVLEADETRRIATMWVQKQEEVVRGAERLYEGLLKAWRLQRTVYAWCRAEGHVGEMSDGEEWVDEEEWGLEGPLRKGMAEDGGDEEGTGTGKKAGRGRRAI